MTTPIDEPAPAIATPLSIQLVRDGKRETFAAEAGEQLLTVLCRAGVELAAICGGKGACGTCRVRIPPAWRDRLPEPLKRELRLLEHLGASADERLSCRIVLAPEHTDLEVHERI